MSEDAPNTLAEADSPGDQGANAKLFASLISTITVLEADRVIGRADGPIVDGAKPPAASRIRA